MPLPSAVWPPALPTPPRARRAPPPPQAAFRDLKLEPEVVSRFHVMGGECNYLLRVTGAAAGVFLHTTPTAWSRFLSDLRKSRAVRAGWRLLSVSSAPLSLSAAGRRGDAARVCPACRVADRFHALVD